MKPLYCSLLAGLLCFVGTAAATEYDIIEKHYFSDESPIPNYIAFAQELRPALEEIDNILLEYWKGKDDFDLRLKSTFIDQGGQVHYKYVQTYKGVDIQFAEWIIHTDQGKINSMNGKLISEYPSTAEFGMTEAEALQSALDQINADVYKWELLEEENMLKTITKDPQATYFPTAKKAYMSSDLDLNTQNLKLCYVFNIYSHEPMHRQEVYVDAANGAIVFSNSLIHTANSQGSAQTGYSGTQSITTDSLNPTSFRLRQTAMGSGINTYDLNNGTNFGNAVDFTDTDNIWNNVNAQLDQYATDAHWGAEKTYEYLNVKFGRNSIDNAGFALNSYVHYGSNFVNAFWNGQWMTYGDGSTASGVTPLTALDVAGHEIAHGLTNFTANLVYASESGALNESFSDIFGAAIEDYARPNRSNWLIGEDMNLIIRSMTNPNSYNDPDTYGGTFWLNVVGCVPSNQNDNCGVHINSGVQNKWFQLLTDGGTGTNDNGDLYNVTALGIDTAAQVAYRNLTVYLIQSSNFNEARFYAIKSAQDLYGPCTPQVESVTRAWYAVGVGNDYVNSVIADYGSTDTAACVAPFNVSFFDESTNGINFLWKFGDGNQSTQRNPSHTYTNFGQYDVTFIVDGGSCGIDSLKKIAYVDIDTNNACVVVLNNGTNPTQTDCNGKIFDSGGPNGNYSNNELGTVTIDPAGASSVTLTFPFFDVEAGTQNNLCDYDYIEFFDGASTSDPSLGRFCNSANPPTSISSTRGPITIQFSTDGGLTLGGFEIDWACSFPTSAPSTDFTVSIDSSCTGEIQFTDVSTQAPSSWFWDFGDGNTSTQRDPLHTYTVDGTYNVKLVSTNSFGSDSITKNGVVYIDRPVGPSITTDTTCTGQTANLTASGAGTLNWYANEFGGQKITSGTSFSVTQPNGDTTFWVEDFISQTNVAAGPLSNTIGNGSFYNGDQYQVFDVYKTLILTDVFVYANGSGPRTIELRDNAGNVLQSKVVSVPNGLANVDLDFLIEPGTDYQLGIDFQGNTPNLYRNTNGASYPYTAPGLLSIKRSSSNSAPLSYYYFFYYWRVKEPDCVSPRIPVTAYKDPSCGVTSLTENSALEDLQIYPNPTSDEVNLVIPAHSGSLEISLWNIEGKKVKDIHYSSNSNRIERSTVDVSDLPKGVYLTRINNENHSHTVRLVIF